MTACPDPVFTASPYPGLRPFRREEADVFFGREEQVDQLLARLETCRFLAVVGVSGCGKSSLVRAGMLSALERGFLASAGPRWQVAEMRPGSHPLSNLAQSLLDCGCLGRDWLSRDDARSFLVAALRRGPLGLVELLRESPAEPGNLLVLVDQFEEVFRFHRHGDANEATAFADLLLASAAQAAIPIYVAITMRSDFLGDCSIFTGLPEAVNAGEFLIPRLTREQCRAAIVGPAVAFGATVEPELVARILNDVGTDPDQLPLIQHALMRVWTRAAAPGDSPESGNGRAVLSIADYEAVGGLKEALSNHADELYGGLSPDAQRIAEVLMRSLSERGGDLRDTRRPAPLATVAAIAQEPPEAVAAVVEVFRQSDCSFLTPPGGVPIEPGTVLDIGHESLIRQWKRMSGWVQAEADSAAIYRRLSETARLWKEHRAALWSTPDLENALAWREREHPNPAWAERYGGRFAESLEFLDASVAARNAHVQEEELRRNRELELLKDKAQAERLRADEAEMRRREQAAANRRLRRRAAVAVAAGLASIGLAVVALLMYLNARSERDRADAARGEAVAARADAEASARQSQRSADAAERAARQMEVSQEEAVAQTLSAYTSLARANLARSQSLWNAAEPGRQQKALELLEDISRLRDESASLLPLLKQDEARRRERTSREWSELLPEIRSQAVRWLSYSSLQPIRQYTVPSRFGSSPLALSPDGSLLAHFEMDPQYFVRGALRLLDTRSGRTTAQIAFDETARRSPVLLQFSADGQALLVVSAAFGQSPAVVALDRRSSTDLSVISSVQLQGNVEAQQYYFGGPRPWHFDRAARTLVHSSGTVKAWDAETGRPLCSLTGVQLLGFNGAGDQLLCAPDRHSVRFVGIDDGKTVRDLRVSTGGQEIHGAWCSPDDRWLAVELPREFQGAGYISPLHVVDLSSERTVSRVNLSSESSFYFGGGSSLRVDFDSSNRLMAAMAGKTVFLISLPDGGILHQARIPDPPGGAQQFSPDELQFSRQGYLLMSAVHSPFGGNQGTQVHFWDWSVARASSSTRIHETPVRALAPAGAHEIALVGGDNTAGRVQVRTRQGPIRWSTSRQTAPSGYDPSGRRFVHVLPDRVDLHDSATGRLLDSIERHLPGANSSVAVGNRFRWVAGVDPQRNPAEFGMFDVDAMKWAFPIPLPVDQDGAVTFSPNDRFVAVQELSSGRGDGASPALSVFRLADGQRVLRLEPGPSEFRFAEPDHLLTASQPGNAQTLTAYHLESGRELGKTQTTGYLSLEHAVHLTPDGRTAVYHASDGGVRKAYAWPFADRRQPVAYEFNVPNLVAVALTNDRLLAEVQLSSPTAGVPEAKPSYSLELCDFKSPAPLKSRAASTAPQLRVSSEHRLALVSAESAEAQQRCEIWDMDSGRDLQPLPEIVDGLSPDARFAVLQSGKVIDLSLLDAQQAASDGAGSPETVVVSPEMRRSRGGPLWFSPDSRFVAYQSELFTVVVRGLRSSNIEYALGTGQNPVISQDSRVLLTQDRLTGRVQARDLADGSLRREIMVRHKNALPLTASDFAERVQASFDGAHVAVRAHGQFRLANVVDGEVHTSLPRSSHDQRAVAVAVCPDGSVVASGSDDRTVCFWNVADGRFLGMLEGFGSPVVAVAFARESPLLATRNEAGGISVWEWSVEGERDTKAVSARFLWGNIEGAGRIARWSPDGSRLAAGDATGSVRLLDARTGELTAMLKPTAGASSIQALAFDPHGPRVALASQSGTMALWNLDSSAVERQWDSGQGAVYDLVFSPTGLLASAGSGVRLWDPQDGQLLFAVDRHTQSVRSVAFSPDGDWLTSVSDDRSEFELNLNDLVRELDQMRFGWSSVHPLEQLARSPGLAAAPINPSWRAASRQEIDIEQARAFHGWPATAAENARDWNEAARQLFRLCEIDSQNLNYRWRLARALSESGRWDEAIPEWERTVQLKPDDVNSHYYLACAVLATDRIDDHLEKCRGVLERFGKTTNADVAARALYTVISGPHVFEGGSVLVALGELAGHARLKGAALYRSGQYAAAIEQLAQQSTYGARPWDMLFLSMAYSKTGKFDEARKLIDDARRTAEAMEESAQWAGWQEALETEHLRREAESLLTK